MKAHPTDEDWQNDTETDKSFMSDFLTEVDRYSGFKPTEAGD
jgi:hypothetical protein